MAKKNYYGVRAGKEVGIYTDWETCLKNVRGYKGAEYKGFVTLEEAKAYMLGKETTLDIDDVDVDYPIAYVDGSYNNEYKVYSYGAVLLLPKTDNSDRETIELKGVGDNEEAAAERNVAGELLGAMAAIKHIVSLGYNKILIKHDYEGIGKWAERKWKANKFCSTNYVKFIDKYRDKIEILFQKVPAHSGVEYNEIADSLAKQAIDEYIEDITE